MTNTPSDAEIDEVTLDVLGYAALDKETNETARMIARAVLAKWGAPQQEAQEPALFVSAKQLASLADPSHATAGSYLPARKTRAGLFTMALYTAPQLAPDCHHRPPCDECAALAAQGGKDA